MVSMLKRGLSALVLGLAVIVVLGWSSTAYAAGEKFVIGAVSKYDSSTFTATIWVLDSGSLGMTNAVEFSASGVNSDATFRTATVNGVVAWAISNGYTGAVAADVLWLRPTFSYNDLLDKPAMVFNNNVSRTLNSSYTISTTRNACVNYSINATWSLNALLSGSGAAYLEYSTDSGTNWTTVNQVSKTLNLLTVAGGDDMNLTGCIPANALTRVRTTSSNMTVSYVRGQEVYQ